MSLNSLPPEIVLQILSYLPISSLANIYSLSQAWNTFLLHHENLVYRHAACFHGIIHDDDAALDTAILRQKYSQRTLRNVDSWKELCMILHLSSQQSSLTSTGQARLASASAMHGTASHLRKLPPN